MMRDRRLDVEYLTRYAQAGAAFEKRIRERIEPEMTLTVGERGPRGLGPGCPEYRELYGATVKDATSRQAIELLNFFYQFDVAFKNDPEYFFTMYEKVFKNKKSSKKISDALHDLPRIDQTTVGIILPFSPA